MNFGHNYYKVAVKVKPPVRPPIDVYFKEEGKLAQVRTNSIDTEDAIKFVSESVIADGAILAFVKGGKYDN